MKSMRNRFRLAFLLSVTAVFVLASLMALYYVGSTADLYSSQALYYMSAQKTEELNDSLVDVERAVHTLCDYVTESVDTDRLRTDRAYAESYLAALAKEAMRLSRLAGYAKSFYFFPDIQKYGPESRLFLLNPQDSLYTVVTARLEDRSVSSGTRASNAWYYEPVAKRKAMWVGPFPNVNTEYESDTISYAFPLYLKGEFFAVVGMDVSMSAIRRTVDNLDFPAAFGILVGSDGALLYHKDFPGGLHAESFSEHRGVLALTRFFDRKYIDTGKNYGYTWQGAPHRIVLNSMQNGMLLAVSVPEFERHRMSTSMLQTLLFLLVIVFLFALVLVNALLSKIIAPMQALTVASSRIARGELNTEITVEGEDEIGALADSIRKITVELKEYIDYINAQAYSDAMTGCRNKSAYMDRVKLLERRMDEDMTELTVYVFDVNGLKRTNDTYGHEYGDMLIKDASAALRAVFNEQTIYRTGGDEFVVLDESSSREKIAANFASFDQHVAAINADNPAYKEPLAVSKGAAVFDHLLDKDFKTLFARADEAMYACKAEYYRTHGDRRRR